MRLDFNQSTNPIRISGQRAIGKKGRKAGNSNSILVSSDERHSPLSRLLPINENRNFTFRNKRSLLRIVDANWQRREILNLDSMKMKIGPGKCRFHGRKVQPYLSAG
ncbi:hypothetical protein GWI33_017935 [Rhynchophorus ferrugineus]|uniref:Uncharacterized protein n=1 Tax=Rhynchophorus ferrugineus TaxID=354439 RepID=A0A834HXA1_RHYFE|nr:hypothetical protein GWI33_017935 [Rhynchophorus ferrugineus]